MARYLATVLGLTCLLLAQNAAALTEEELSKILHGGTPAEAEDALSKLERDIIAGEEPHYARGAPYAALGRLHPKVYDFIARWKAEYPASPYVKLAEAKQHYDIALIVRGHGYVQDTPETSMQIMYERFSAAKPLLLGVLKDLPDNLAAAEMLSTIGSYTGDPEAKARGAEVTARVAPPSTGFWRDNHRMLPQWGGSMAQIKRHCREVGPSVDVNPDVCVARAILKAHPRPQGREEAVETLMREEPGKHNPLVLEALLDLGRGEDAMALIEEYDYWVGGVDSKRLAMLLGDSSLIVRFTERWLSISPEQPNFLASAAEGYTFEGQREKAVAAIDTAMIHGRTIPKVRRWQLHFAWQDPDKRERIFEYVWEALDDTTWHPNVYDQAMPLIAGASEEITHLKDGTPKPKFHCDRAAFLSALPDVCAYWRRGTYCTPKQMQRISEIAASIDISDCG